MKKYTLKEWLIKNKIMSKKHDAMRAVRITPENIEKLQLIQSQLPISTTLPKLANKAIEDWEGFYANGPRTIKRKVAA